MLTSQLLYDEINGWKQLSGDNIQDPQVILAFGMGEGFVKNAYRTLREKFPKSDIIGCTTAGTIVGTQVDDISVATLISLEKGKMQVVSQEFSSTDESELIGQNIAKSLLREELKHIFILSDGLHINGTNLTAGLNRELPQSVHVTGGLAGDGTAFNKTHIIANADAKEKCVVALGFYGNSLEVNSSCFAGWDEFGAERLITRSEGNIVYEIDSKPALGLYKTYLADEIKDLPASGLKFPFSIREDASKKPIIRTFLAINEEEQSLTFAGDVPEMYRCRLMKSNIDKLIDNAGLAAEQAKSNKHSHSLCLAVSCFGRRVVLSQLVEEELDIMQDVFGEETQLSGFYSYGEIAPLDGLDKCALHNQTMTLTVISEEL